MEKRKTKTESILLMEETKKYLRVLASKYEKSSFIKNDPSIFMHNYSNPKDQEIAAFIASCLSFGRRDQILLKSSSLLKQAGQSPAEWIYTGGFKKTWPVSEEKFYRIYSYEDILKLYISLQQLLLKYGSLGNAVYSAYNKLRDKRCANKEMKCKQQLLIAAICNFFPNNRLIPQNQASACKRLNMFLRWMVRQNSPVDLGLWSWYDSSDLIIPLDTHVLQESKNLEILPLSIPENFKTAQLLTNTMKQIWPSDPCRADFALFGLGIEKSG